MLHYQPLDFMGTPKDRALSLRLLIFVQNWTQYLAQSLGVDSACTSEFLRRGIKSCFD